MSSRGFHIAMNWAITTPETHVKRFDIVFPHSDELGHHINLREKDARSLDSFGSALAVVDYTTVQLPNPMRLDFDDVTLIEDDKIGELLWHQIVEKFPKRDLTLGISDFGSLEERN